MKKTFLSTVLALLTIHSPAWAENLTLTDSASKITVEVSGNGEKASIMTFKADGKQVMELPAIGIVTDYADAKPWQIKSIVSKKPVTHDYDMKTGKRLHCSNQGTEYRLNCSDSADKILVVRIYDDGVAFRYELKHEGKFSVTDELTTYRISEGTERWLQEFRNDYEGFYKQTTTGKDAKPQYGFPALFHTNDGAWSLISEANVNRGQSASSLRTDNMPEGNYRVAPAGTVSCNGGEWISPWRVAVIGELDNIVESTLVTDVSAPTSYEDTDWIKPGVVSWIYWGYNHGSKDYPTVIKYIDMAAELKLPYILIDWEWDVMGNGGNIDDAIKYADAKNIKVLVWYNSSTAWTDQAAGPLFRLNKPEDREKEFSWLESKGVAGVKIDFFSGDGPEVMDYCIDLLESAARHHLLVNFHGATIPRGWQRTYPNFMSAEAVYGAEWYNNNAVLTPVAAAHNTTLPFTRNVIGPMDYTPCTFSDSQHPHLTTSAHELALTVAFESGLQHLADTPESYLAQPKHIRKFLESVPAVWDDTKLLSGFPGHHVAIARKSGNKWFVALLNGTTDEIVVSPDWQKLNLGKKYLVELYCGSGRVWTSMKKDKKVSEKYILEPRGGAVLVITEK